jgi:hypothetical protein
MPELGDQPISDEFYESMNTVARMLDEIFNGENMGTDRKVGFVLMLFPFNGQDGRCNFISNGADRHDVVVLMKEMISRFEGMAQVSGHA